MHCASHCLGHVTDVSSPMAHTDDDGHHKQLGALVRPDRGAWRPILQASNQVVLYNPTSHALSVDLLAKSHAPSHRTSCPYCKQALPADFDSHGDEPCEDSWSGDPVHPARAANYFQLLELSNETLSRPASPPPVEVGNTTPGSRSNGRTAFPAEAMAEGYFKAFFQEEYKLGMGANGSVFLCQASHTTISSFAALRTDKNVPACFGWNVTWFVSV